MPEDVKSLVDLDDEHLSRVRFGRSRFLRILGVGLFGLATGMVAAPELAEAAPTPYPCSGAPGCNNCRGARCANCSRAYTCGGSQCWTTAVPNGSCKEIYRCCDWYNRRGRVCVCRGYVGRRC